MQIQISKADVINGRFVGVSKGFNPLDTTNLPAYLPSISTVPHLYPWNVCAELKKFKI